MNHAQRPEVGIVGAKLLFPPNGKVQHAGVVVGMRGGRLSIFVLMLRPMPPPVI